MGLLDSMPQQGMPQAAPQIGGLLGSAPPQIPQAQGMQAPSQGGNPMQLLISLSKSPTPQIASQVVAALMQKGTPEAKQMAQALDQMKDSPEAVKKFADGIMQQLGG